MHSSPLSVNPASLGPSASFVKLSRNFQRALFPYLRPREKDLIIAVIALCDNRWETPQPLWRLAKEAGCSEPVARETVAELVKVGALRREPVPRQPGWYRWGIEDNAAAWPALLLALQTRPKTTRTPPAGPKPCPPLPPAPPPPPTPPPLPPESPPPFSFDPDPDPGAGSPRSESPWLDGPDAPPLDGLEPLDLDQLDGLEFFPPPPPPPPAPSPSPLPPAVEGLSGLGGLLSVVVGKVARIPDAPHRESLDDVKVFPTPSPFKTKTARPYQNVRTAHEPTGAPAAPVRTCAEEVTPAPEPTMPPRRQPKPVMVRPASPVTDPSALPAGCDEATPAAEAADALGALAASLCKRLSPAAAAARIRLAAPPCSAARLAAYLLQEIPLYQADPKAKNPFALALHHLPFALAEQAREEREARDRALLARQRAEAEAAEAARAAELAATPRPAFAPRRVDPLPLSAEHRQGLITGPRAVLDALDAALAGKGSAVRRGS